MSGPQLEDGFTRIANELLEIVPTYRFTASQLDIILIVWRYTYGFGRKDHDLSITFLAEATEIDERNIRRELNFLIDTHVLIITQKSTNKFSRKIGFNKKYNEWSVLKRRVERVDMPGQLGFWEGAQTRSGEGVQTPSGEGVQTLQERKVLKKISKEIIYSRFEEFWSYYPKKVGKKDALKHFERLHKDKDFSFEEFVLGTKNYVDYCNKTNRYFKDGSAFVNQETYKDFLEMPEVPDKPKGIGSGSSKADRNKQLLQSKMKEAKNEQRGNDKADGSNDRGLPDGGAD